MDRRMFLGTLASGLLAAPLGVEGQKRDGRPAPASRHRTCYLASAGRR